MHAAEPRLSLLCVLPSHSERLERVKERQLDRRERVDQVSLQIR